MYTAMYSKD